MRAVIPQVGIGCLIVCHVGQGTGLGHLTRSLAIARSLEHDLNGRIALIICGEPLRRDDLSRFKHEFVGPDADLEERIFSYTDFDLAILDLDPRKIPLKLDQTLGHLRRKGLRLVSIDGLLQYRTQLDLIFIPSLAFQDDDLLTGGAPVVSGWDCFLLDDQIPPIAWAPGNKVLVLTGGSDATNLGQTLPSLLDKSLNQDTEIEWVTGPFSKRPLIPINSRPKFTEHISPSGLGSLIRDTNYALTIFGVSFFELIKAGIPTVVFSPYGQKDGGVLEAIANSDIAIVTADERQAVAALKRLMGDHHKARRMSESGKVRMSNSGTVRFSGEVARLFFNRESGCGSGSDTSL